MSSMFIITDPEAGKDYDIELSPDELKRMKKGNNLLISLL